VGLKLARWRKHQNVGLAELLEGLLHANTWNLAVAYHLFNYGKEEVLLSSPSLSGRRTCPLKLLDWGGDLEIIPGCTGMYCVLLPLMSTNAPSHFEKCSGCCKRPPWKSGVNLHQLPLFLGAVPES